MLVTADFQEENIAMADYLNSHERLAPYYEAARQEAAEPKRLVPVDALKAFKGVSFVRRSLRLR